MALLFSQLQWQSLRSMAEIAICWAFWWFEKHGVYEFCVFISVIQPHSVVTQHLKRAGRSTLQVFSLVNIVVKFVFPLLHRWDFVFILYFLSSYLFLSSAFSQFSRWQTLFLSMLSSSMFVKPLLPIELLLPLFRLTLCFSFLFWPLQISVISVPPVFPNMIWVV